MVEPRMSKKDIANMKENIMSNVGGRRFYSDCGIEIME